MKIVKNVAIVVLILIGVIVAFVANDNMSYMRSERYDAEIARIIKSGLQNGKTVTQIQADLESHKRELGIKWIKLSTALNNFQPASERKKREVPMFIIESSIFSWKGFGKGLQGPMHIDIDEDTKEIMQYWLPM